MGKKKTESPTSRTLKRCRANGWLIDVAEKFVPSFGVSKVTNAAREVARMWLDSRVQVLFDHQPREVLEARLREVIPAVSELIDAIEILDRVGPGKRQDIFGFVDLIAVAPCTADDNATDWVNGRHPSGIIAIQATTTSNQASRIKKVINECGEEARKWIDAGGRIQVWGWGYYQQKVDRRNWRETIHEVVASDVAVPEKPF